MRKVVLASASPRRKELLSLILDDFEIIPAQGEEVCDDTASPEEQVKELARGKAEDVFAKHPDALVIGCDTLVFCEGEVLHKPKDREDAARMLRLMSGKTHMVSTGVCIKSKDFYDNYAVTAEVTFASLEESEVQFYISTGESMGKSGAYAVQGAAAALIEKVEGDQNTVVGFPLRSVYLRLRDLGYFDKFSLE